MWKSRTLCGSFALVLASGLGCAPLTLKQRADTQTVSGAEARQADTAPPSAAAPAPGGALAAENQRVPDHDARFVTVSRQREPQVSMPASLFDTAPARPVAVSAPQDVANEDTAFGTASGGGLDLGHGLSASWLGQTDEDSASDGGLGLLGGLGYGLSASLLGQTAEQSEIDDFRRRIEALERQSSASDDGTDDPEASGEADATGTDPRGFGTKFMPYYRFTELKNSLRTNELVLFGLYKFSDSFAATYEIPIAKNIEYGSVREFESLSGAIPPGSGGGAPPTGIPIDDLESDGDNVGVGDSVFRIFAKNDHLRFENPIGPGQLEIMPGLQTTVPTATNDVIGGEAWLAAPMLIVVVDMPFNGFFALMNFYQFDIVRDGSRQSVERYIGRHFYMQPLTPPQFMAKNNPDIPDLGFWLSGFYLLPELQPIYDFENDQFSLWFGPEIGKIFWEGRMAYVKPGFGIDQERTDRKFTFEVGMRWFF